MNNHQLVELLEKYINGECTEAEKRAVKQWYYSFEEEPDYWDDLDRTEEMKMRERIYENIIARINQAATIEVQRPNHRYRALRSWYTVAATVAFFLTVIALVFYKKDIAKNSRMAAGSSQQFTYITNNTNQLYKATLPDKSIVWLSPNAHLKYPKAFDARFRLVSMSGDCFFEVTKNPKRPFIISSRSIITKVWGTSFRVRDNAESDSAEVAVVTGKVSVSIKTKDNISNSSLQLQKGEVILYPHQRAVYALDQHILKEEKISNEPSLQLWSRVKLSFDNKPLKDIIPVLNAKYHVHIVISNEKLDSYILNADFDEFNLPDMLEALKKSLNINYEIKNNTIELQPTN